MKKIIYSTLSLLLFFTASCSNEEINTEIVGRLGNLTCNVNTQGIYDHFGITNDVRDTYLRDHSRAIGVRTFLYKENGELVRDVFTTLSAFNVASQKFEGVEEGKYTIITVETLMNPDVNNVSDDWSFEGIENISTLKLKAAGTLGWASILGVSTQPITIMGDKEINIQPSVVGARVHFYVFNYKNATETDANNVSKPIVELGFATSDILEYYNLNPQLQIQDRYVENVTSSGYTNVRATIASQYSDDYIVSCYIVEPEITCRFSWQIESSDLWWHYDRNNITAPIVDGKEYYAGFYYMGKDYYPSSYFGDQNGLITWKQNCDASSSSSSSSELYAVPYTQWSVGTVSAVKTYMTNFTLYEDVTQQSSGKYHLTYYDANNYTTLYMYEFKTATSGLTDVYVGLSTDHFTLEQVQSELLNKGYTYVSQSGDYYIYRNSTTAVLLSVSGSVIIVNYYDPSAYSSQSQKLQAPRMTMEVPFDALNNKEAIKLKQNVFPAKESRVFDKQMILRI